MLVGLYSAATGLHTAERMHEVIAENLAHVSVPGYRGRVLNVETFEQAFSGQLTEPSPEGHGSATAEMTTDFTHGPTSRTGRTLDLALGGDGFFEVAGPDGPLYTRNGVFFLNEANQMVNGEGMAVMGDGGPIQIPANVTAAEITIGRDGTVSTPDAIVGRLRRVTFADEARLIRAGTTLFETPFDMQPQDAESVVMQGVREQSNVSAVNEMVRMIVGTRHYEAAQKALTTMDEAIGQVTDPRA